MKQTENNEMDLLLRALARRESARPVASEDQSSSHLDADELSSYAEQAVPAAARARYTSHLVDCASCRQIVSDLASAAGAKVSEPSASPQTPAGFREMFAALFSVRVLRYAVPALALFAFIAVGLVALRQQSYREFVAQNQSGTDSAVPAVVNQPETLDTAKEEGRSAVSRSREDNQGKTQEGIRDTQEPSVDRPADPARATTATTDRDTSLGKNAGVVAQPSYAPEPAAPPPAKPQATPIESKSEVASRQKEEADKKRDEPAREQQAAREGRDDRQNEAASPQARRAPIAVQSGERTRTPDAVKESEEAVVTIAGGAKAKDNEADTRTVSGRQFRRQGGRWIDTDYQSSTGTTTVLRSSEQFRALAADEPGIRAIAAQLAGEVIVVWKGRAYRIR